MRTVSEGSTQALGDLVIWWMTGQETLDPKSLLRQVSLPDLSIIAANVEEHGGESDCFVIKMVNIELAYRLGKLRRDWEWVRDGLNVDVTYEPIQPINYVRCTVTLVPLEIDA